MNNVNEAVKKVEYAVRGPLVVKAYEMSKQMEEGKKFPFTELVFSNIGDPQNRGQKPLTYNRQVLSLLMNPQLVSNSAISNIYPSDVIDRAQLMLRYTTNGNGQYTQSAGMPFIRENVADFIQARDGYDCDPNDIYLTDGASIGIKAILELLIRGPNDGILVPVPTYPLYTAVIPEFGGTSVLYQLDEENGWSLDVGALRKNVQEFKKNGGEVRGLVVINPNNPTGTVLTKENIEEIIKFCHEEEIVILADEVYQENCYFPEQFPFHSFKKVLRSMGEKYQNTQLASFHSTSKGIMAECGMRGGYMEVLGFDQDIVQTLYKLRSIFLCPNVVGQLCVDLMVKSPPMGSQSYSMYRKEYHDVYESLKRRSIRLVKTLNKLEGVSCQPVNGAMYCFPQITLPPKAIAKAQELGMQPDALYALRALEQAGLVVVPGSGFGQKPGTWHFRTTFLPQEDEIEGMCTSLKKFHDGFMAEFA